MFLTIDIKQQVISEVRQHIQAKVDAILGSKKRLLDQAAAETQGLRSREDSNQARDQLLSQNETMNERARALRQLEGRLHDLSVPMDFVQEGAFIGIEEQEEGAETLTGGGFYFLLESDKNGHGCGGDRILVPGFGWITVFNPSASRAQALLGKGVDESVQFCNRDGKKARITITDLI